MKKAPQMGGSQYETNEALSTPFDSVIELLDIRI